MQHIALFLFSSLLSKRNKFSLCGILLCFIILFCFNVLNADASWDYRGYQEYYRCSTFAHCGPQFAGMVEKSFSEISIVVHSIFGNEGAAALIALYASVSLAIKLYVLDRRSTAFGFALFAYIGFGWFIHEMTQIRVGLAVAFLWLALSEFEDKDKGRRWGAFVFFLIAVAIHASALIGLVYLAVRRVPIDRIFPVLLLIGVSAICGRLAEELFFSFAFEGYGDFAARLILYLAAREGDILTTSQVNMFSLTIMALILLAVHKGGVSAWNKFEIGALKCLITGLAVYMLLYWIPVVGLRVFEIYASFIPFVAAACVHYSKRDRIKYLVILFISAIFFNMIIRNGLMMDLVFNWQAQYARLMEMK